MGKLKGIDVELVLQKKVGIDPFGASIQEEESVTISNVLVGQPSSEDVTSSLSLYGKRGSYVLGIPKNDKHNWENKEIRFWGKRFRSYGAVIQGIDKLIPLAWNKKVMVEYYD